LNLGIEIADNPPSLKMGGLNMKCSRCGGKMVFEKFYGICEEFFGWRCIFCGEIVDKVIMENRIEQKR
jgi:DNA-directed RNA polymerase subunit RPC12/RpoP